MLPTISETAAPIIIGIPKPNSIPALKVDPYCIHHCLLLNLWKSLTTMSPNSIVKAEGIGSVAPKAMLTAETGILAN